MVARDPARAWQHVLAILANIADLHDGDTITVRRNEDPWTDSPAE